MMRKLAVTVFALSLSAFGCGSDSGGNKPDTAVGVDSGKTTDTIVTDAPIADTPLTPDTQVGMDGPVVDAPVVDVAQHEDVMPSVDTPAVDVQEGVDGQAIDSVKPVLDGGAHDSGPAVDAEGMDSGSKG